MNVLTPIQKYQADIDSGVLLADASQKAAVLRLQSLYETLLVEDARTNSKNKISSLLTSFSKLASNFSAHKTDRQAFIKGVYFWGGVGRGKTYLLDVFFEVLPISGKLRLHFHRFMQMIHQQLTMLQGEADPLEKIAENLARQYRVICLDEFFVKDITDAMILAGLLDALFRRRVVLVTTSNIEPASLYEDGLQRVRFLPAIALLEKHTDVINVDSGVDYRLRALERAELYHYPLDGQAWESLQRSFVSLVPEGGQAGKIIDVLGRPIRTVVCADEVVWFEFEILCGGPRSQNDYIELARVYQAVLIANVPVMSAANDDAARRFINLVDEFYDRSVKLILSAAVSIENLYGNGRLGFEFSRTRSRLLEMQSHDYLGRAHRP